MKIEYVPYKNIDKTKWDNCINTSYNSLIYSTSAYLDIMAGTWDGLVLDDYEAVMPLPWRKKYGIYYIYPPAFTQQLGVNSIKPLTPDVIHVFLDTIPKKFRYIEMNLNATNFLNGHNTTRKKNHVLDITQEYQCIKKGYSRSALRNIFKANSGKLSIINNVPAKEILLIHRSRFHNEIGISKSDYNKLLLLIQRFQKTDNCYIIGAKNNKGILIAGSIYFIFKERIYFVANGNTPESLKNGGTHFLMDQTIRTYANKGFIIDFEGSDTPSFARFYEQYGAKQENYLFLKLNRLPWLFKLFKH